MPIDFIPRERMVNAPKSGALTDAWNSQLKAYGKNPGSMLGGFGEFEQGQTVKVDSGRVELNANEIIAGAIKQPAYALEAPLRPFNVATGGAVGGALETAWGVGKSIPILGLAFNALEGVGGVLEASNKAGKALLNYSLAEHLRQTRGKPDNWESSFMGETLKASEVRKRVMERWGVDPLTGQEFTLAQLEARAVENTMNFGDFNVHENGFLNFGAQILADPLNVAMLGSGTLVGLTGKALKAAPWARPAVNLGTRVAGAPRIGYGALKATGRVVTQTPTGAKFMDEFNSARAILNGTLQQHGTLAGALRATSWAMRGLYVPGYASAVARGRNPAMAAVTAWTRGGMQQQIATNAAEQLIGMSGGWMQDKGLDTQVQDGFTSWVHDALNKINNDHLLSDYEGFTVMALFSPWASALGDIRRSAKMTTTKGRMAAYADDTLREVKDSFRREFGENAKYDDMFKRMGKGDVAAGKAAWEWFVDQADVLKAGNQLSSFTRNIVELDDIAVRTQFLTKTAVEKVLFLREKAALMPKSSADFMIDLLKRGPLDEAGETLAAEMSITPDMFYKFVGNMYRANQQFAPQLAKLGGIQLEQGAPITRELIDAMIELIDDMPPGSVVDRELAAQLMAGGPSLVYEGEFFSRFAATLGQRQPGGKFRRPDTMAENVTNAQLKERLTEIRESAPPAGELFHEAVSAGKNTTRIKPGETLITEPPYPLPTKLEARRVYNTGRVRQLIRTMNTLRDVRNAEFFKNGKPRIQAAKELTGHEGGVFKRQGPSNVFARELPEAAAPITRESRSQIVKKELDELRAERMKAQREAGEELPPSPREMVLQDEYNNLGLTRDELAEIAIERAFTGEYGDPGGPVRWTEDNPLVLDTRRGRFADESVDVRPENAPTGRRLEDMPDGTPNSVVFDDMGVSAQSVWYGPDGRPAAYASALRRNFGDPTNPGPYEHLSVYVDPKYRRQGVATKLYDELERQGVDIRSISQKSVTAEGRAFTDKFWSRREPRPVGMAFSVEDGVIRGGTEGFPMSLDSEALVLAAQNGGRTIVFPRAEGEFLASHGFVEVAAIRSGAVRSALGHAKEEAVPINIIDKLKAVDREVNPYPRDNVAALTQSIRDEGFKEPLLLEYSQETGEVLLVEGNHRLAAAKRLGLSHVPVRVIRRVGPFRDAFKGRAKPADKFIEPNEFGYVPGDLKPSEILNFPNTGSPMAAFAFRGGDVTKIVANRNAGAFAPYKPALKEVAAEATAIKLARKYTDAASITDPSTYASRVISKDARHMNPDERLVELNRLRDQADLERRALMKQISESDRLAMEISGMNTNIGKLGDWFNAASKTEIDGVMQLVKDVNRDFPGISVREGQGLWVDPRADRFSTLLTQRSLARRMAFDYGYLSPINFLYTALAAPVNARHLGKQAQTEMHNLLAQSGFTAAESKKFAELLRKEVIESRSVEGTLGERTGAHMYRTVRAIPEGKINALFDEAAKGKGAEVIKRFGSGQRMITEASNRMLRNAATRGRGGGRIDPLSRAMNAAFRIWQYTPGLNMVSSATHEFTKLIYPWFRFKMDPFYHVMNWVEPDVYAISMEGMKASRWNKGGINRAQSSNAAEQASVTSIPPGGLVTKDVPIDVLMADTGAYTMPRNIRPVLERHFDINRYDSANDVWRAMKHDDPAARVMVEHFGDDVNDWVAAGDEMMYGYMTKGPEATVMDGAREVLDDMGISLDEAKYLVPHIERLASAHRGQYNDLVQLYIGRMNRPGIERMLDNFWLLWPLSYQIKATTWLATIMFKRIGGVNLGMAPAAMWNEYRQRWEAALEADPELKSWTEDNDAFLFVLEMAFPMTPQGIGASLSRPTRYVGSWIADGLEIPDDIKQQFLGDYPNIRTLPELAENSIIVGPVRTERLIKRILDSFEVPGFTPPASGDGTVTLPELPR